MSVIRPAGGFLKVLLTDIDRVGMDEAAILALVRYATAITDERNGRLVIDGAVWWRVSYTDLGVPLRMSRESVRHLVGKLEAANELESRFQQTSDGDRTKLYHIPSEQPLHDFNTPLSSENTISTGGVVKMGRGCVENVLSTTSLENLEKGEKRARTRANEPPSRKAVPDSGDDPPPPKIFAEEQPPAPKAFAEAVADVVIGGGPELSADTPPFIRFAQQQRQDPEPPEYCSRHMPDGTDDPCGGCARAGHKHKAWRRRRLTLLDELKIGIRQQIEDCGRRCNDYGQIGGKHCPNHPNFKQDDIAALMRERKNLIEELAA